MHLEIATTLSALELLVYEAFATSV
jgi:hypothetical protein